MEYFLDLMQQNQVNMLSIFSSQIDQIGLILMALSLTLIPTLIGVMFYVRKLFMDHVKGRV
jgi:hypothetical protein